MAAIYRGLASPIATSRRGNELVGSASFTQLTPAHPLASDKLTVLPLVQIQRARDRSICIGVEMICEAERKGRYVGTQREQ